MSLLGLYRPGTTWVHRMPVGAKLSGLAVLGIAVTVVRGPLSALAFLMLSVAIAAAGRIGVRRSLRTLRSLLVVLVLLGGYQWWQRGWPVAVEVVADLVCLVLAATVVTATTPMDALLDAFVRACRPLRRLGANPDRIGLAMALMVRAVPGLLDIARETRDAAKARGLERNPRALLVPMTLRTVGRARTTGEALAARGIGDE
ncbi:energy-coupling factor transporter transmembrane component T family protein [Solicola gregarius]|uniref:Energy-coupling factor transporter transmembrane protein EcfT n=1 Tax=Solicola gregarius TaxID=2908642 RepID=A0AA46YNS5_9ACTN|nr:energy-coupling factor transporter transmembrane protein EcfT [Solicola gregarius]UYM07781.1 energy-coupling factor transporter transmembrane protein EcfT [Solicola gregarius]